MRLEKGVRALEFPKGYLSLLIGEERLFKMSLLTVILNR